MRFRLFPKADKIKRRNEETTLSQPEGKCPPPSIQPSKRFHNRSSAVSISSSSLSTGPGPGPFHGVQPFMRQLTGPFPHHGTQGDKDSCNDLGDLNGYEITKGELKVIPSCSSSRSLQPPIQNVEILPSQPGADDDTLEDILDEKKSSSGILATLRRSNSRLFDRSTKGKNDDDTLEAIMNDSDVDRTEERRDTFRRVGSNILDRLKRSNPKNLNNHELWLKIALQAIEEARNGYAHTSSDESRNQESQNQEPPPPATQSTDVYKEIANISDHAKDEIKDIVIEGSCPCSATSSASSSSTTSAHLDGLGGQCNTTSNSQKLQPNPKELVKLPQEPIQKQNAISLQDNATEDLAGAPPQDTDDISVALVEVFVHYLTCCQVLREQEVNRSPRGFCIDPSTEEDDALRDHLLSHRTPGLCVHDCVELVDDISCSSDDDTRDESLLLEAVDTITSELARSATASTCEKEDFNDQGL